MNHFAGFYRKHHELLLKREVQLRSDTPVDHRNCRNRREEIQRPLESSRAVRAVPLESCAEQVKIPSCLGLQGWWEGSMEEQETVSTGRVVPVMGTAEMFSIKCTRFEMPGVFPNDLGHEAEIKAQGRPKKERKSSEWSPVLTCLSA